MSNQEETHPIDTFVLSWISKHLLDGKVPSTSVPIFQMTNQLDDDECCQKLQCDFEQEFNVKEADCINPEMTAQDIIEHFKQSVSL